MSAMGHEYRADELNTLQIVLFVIAGTARPAA